LKGGERFQHFMPERLSERYQGWNWAKLDFKTG